MKVAVTGAGGFVGRALSARLRAQGVEVLPIVRSPAGLPGERRVADLDGDTDWRGLLAGTEAIVHLAARVHLTRDKAVDPLAEYRRVNLDGTLRLAREAAEAGVRRFVFMSSIKVNGEATEPDRPFRRADRPAPTDAYGISKYEAELGLREIGARLGMETVIIRPPLVYGPGAGGNFRTMIDWLGGGIPLPLGSVTANRRSLVGIDNLVDLTALCLDHPAAADKLYLVSDGEDVSTRRLLELIAAAMGRRARLVPVPPALLAGAARAIGKAGAADRLLGNLQVDMEETRRELGWAPPVSLREGLARVARTS